MPLMSQPSVVRSKDATSKPSRMPRCRHAAAAGKGANDVTRVIVAASWIGKQIADADGGAEGSRPCGSVGATLPVGAFTELLARRHARFTKLGFHESRWLFAVSHAWLPWAALLCSLPAAAARKPRRLRTSEQRR